MRLAIPQWQDRISPVFDVAGSLLLIDLEQGAEIGRHKVALEEDSIQGRAKCVASLNAKVLICGAISRPLELALVAAGIEVIPQTCGEIEQVVRAYVTGQLHLDTFLMPGCCGQRRGFRRGRRGNGRP